MKSKKVWAIGKDTEQDQYKSKRGEGEKAHGSVLKLTVVDRR
jgi:hypothetical protein